MSALLLAMSRQAEDEKTRVLAQAEKQVADIRLQGQAEAEAIRAEAGREVKRQVRIHSERILGEIEAQERDELLELKRQLLDATFQTAKAKQQEMMAGDGYARCIARLIEEAVATVGDNVRVSVAASDQLICRDVLERMDVTGCVEIADEPGTVIVASMQGRKRVDNSLSTRLVRAKSLMQAQVAGVLFDTSGSEGEST